MGTPLAHHVMMRLDDGRVIARSGPEYRTAAAALLKQGEARGLLAFRVVDSHIHALLVCDRETAGAFARYAGGSLSKRLGLATPFSPARIDPVRTQSHLANTFLYVLRQERRHGIDSDPMHDGSSVPELLGMRVVAPWLRARVAAHLPRVRRSDLEPALGVAFSTEGASEPPTLHIAALEESAAAAFALPRLVARRDTLAVEARLAAVHSIRDATLADVATPLAVDVATVCRLRSRVAPPAHVRAVTLQLAARSRLRAATPA